MSASNYQRSRQVLQALVQGVDPDQGSALPADTVLNRVDVVRALLTAIEAIDAVNARAQRRAQLPESVGKAWSEPEEGQLRDESVRGEPITLIAAKHGRTVRAIEARLERLGLLEDGRRTTSGIFLGKGRAKEDKS
jgi:hypothetical protein